MQRARSVTPGASWRRHGPPHRGPDPNSQGTKGQLVPPAGRAGQCTHTSLVQGCFRRYHPGFPGPQGFRAQSRSEDATGQPESLAQCAAQQSHRRAKVAATHVVGHAQSSVLSSLSTPPKAWGREQVAPAQPLQLHPHRSTAGPLGPAWVRCSAVRPWVSLLCPCRLTPVPRVLSGMPLRTPHPRTRSQLEVTGMLATLGSDAEAAGGGHPPWGSHQAPFWKILQDLGRLRDGNEKRVGFT